MRVAMQVPQQLPAENHLGLLLLFHGFRGHENNYIGLTVEALQRLQLLEPDAVSSGKAKGPDWTTEASMRSRTAVAEPPTAMAMRAALPIGWTAQVAIWGLVAVMGAVVGRQPVLLEGRETQTRAEGS